jgi:recombination protein RecA
MPTAAALRLEIEHALEHRFPAALTPAPCTNCEVAPTGIAPIDELLHGGLPVGAISELTGAASSGRTTLALQFAARLTTEARPCAWVDVNDAFDPESAAANGMRLKQLLWMRCRDEGAAGPMPNRATSGTSKRRARPSWTRLDQALRATDLLLQAGGFAAIVLDLGDTALEQASRIPLATWFRFRQAAERTQSSLVVLGRRAYAQSAAAVVLECSAQRVEQAGGTVLRGFAFTVRRGRERKAPVEITTRKPVAATWQANAAWNADVAIRA